MTAASRISGWLTPEDHARAKQFLAEFSDARRWRSILSEVAQATGFSEATIMSKRKVNPAATRAKWLAWSIAHREGVPLAAIGRACGYDHSSILFGIRRDAEERATTTTEN